MKILFTTLLLILSIELIAQTELTFPIIDNAHKFNWKSIEKKASKSIVDKFIRDNPKYFEVYRQTGEDALYHNLDSLRKDLHFIDINGDKKDDIVFDGWSGGEPRMIQIFINTGQSYKEVFTVLQGIVKMDWFENRLSKIYIDDWGCCAEYLAHHQIYSVNYEKTNTPVFHQIYQSVSIYYAAPPKKLLDTFFRFEVLNQGYNIRSEPIIDDTSYQMWNNDKPKGAGNTIGKLVKGSTGIALCKNIDASGREWVYVEIDEEFLPRNETLYIKNKFPTKVAGWISGRFIKRM